MRTVHDSRSRRRRFPVSALPLAGLFLLVLTNCGKDPEEARLDCLVDYLTRSSSGLAEVERDGNDRASNYAAVVQQFDSLLQVSDETGWRDCPEDFLTARTAALASYPGFRDGMQALLEGERGNYDLAKIAELQTATRQFSEDMGRFTQIMAQYLADEEVAGRLDQEFHDGIDAYLQNRRRGR